MSTVKRKYEYYDQGVLPEEGEYGITYLTLYSSTSGNIYDGWIYDPDNKIPVSVTERTFGYRHPEFSQYCWDDEVVVDLSNPQAREESDFTQGRIVSFNTNVSPYPIVLQDIDISEMTESERERNATTVLFTAIPLVSDAYIQAQVEVQCKCNLSPDNTSGEMRIEAFYILNDESDRTMRPNPVHTFTVSSANERHTLPWLYFNPALRHEDNNYIGVKLICTGGTAEIGISDVREYGDAIITLTSAGLTGDNIFAGKPVSLDIFGLEEVAPGYELDIEDYTVFCEYDTGEVYEVTRLCDFNPAMGTEIVDPVTILTALYSGLSASMAITLGMIDHIELSGNESIHGSYTLDIDDYTVMAYFDNGDEWDVTELCSFSPAMGTTVTENTTLTATLQPSWMPESTFTDSLELTKIGVRRQTSSSYDLIYTLYDDNVLVISGGVSDSWVADTSNYESDAYLLSTRNVYAPGQTVSQWNSMGIHLNDIQANQSFFTVSGKTLRNVSMNFSINDVNQYNQGSSIGSHQAMYYCIVCLDPFGFTMAESQTLQIEWRATGKPLGICTSGGGSYINYHLNKNVKFVNFDKMDTSKIITLASAFVGVSESDLSWIFNKDFPELLDITCTFIGCEDNPSLINSNKSLNAHKLVNISGAFSYCSFNESIPKFVSELDTKTVKRADALFMYSSFENTDALYNWTMPELLCSNGMFRSNEILKSVAGLKNLRMNKNTDFGCMFASDVELEDIGSILSSWGNNAETGTNTGSGGSNGVCAMFAACRKLKKAHGIGLFLNKLPKSGSSVAFMFAYSGITSLLSFAGAITNKISQAMAFMYSCRDLTDFTGAETWDMSEVTMAWSMFGSETNIAHPPSKLSHVSGWRLSSMVNPSNMFYATYIKTSSTTLEEANAAAEQALSILSGWNHHLPGSDYIYKHYFNQPNQGYEIIYRHYNGSSYTNMTL